MIRIRKIILALMLLQVWAILLALIIEKTIDMMTEARELTDLQTIVVLGGVWAVIGIVIFMFYDDLGFVKSIEGLLDRLLPDEEIQQFKKVWKKVNKGKELTEKEQNILREFEKRGYLKKGFTDQHLLNRWSPMQVFRMKAMGFIIVIILIISYKKPLKIDSKIDSNEPNPDQRDISD